MKRTSLLCMLLSMVVLAGPAFAQDPGDVGIFFDPAGTQSRGTVLASVPFFLYVVGSDLPGNTAGYEGSLAYDAGLNIILSATFTGPGPINIGNNSNWIVGAGGCVNATGPTVLVTLQMFPLVAVPDAIFCIGPSSPSSFIPPTPGYLDCADGLSPFGVAQSGGGVYPDGCAVANPSDPEYPVGADVRSWSSVKAQF